MDTVGISKYNDRVVHNEFFTWLGGLGGLDMYRGDYNPVMMCASQVSVNIMDTRSEMYPCTFALLSNALREELEYSEDPLERVASKVNFILSEEDTETLHERPSQPTLMTDDKRPYTDHKYLLDERYYFEKGIRVRRDVCVAEAYSLTAHMALKAIKRYYSGVTYAVLKGPLTALKVVRRYDAPPQRRPMLVDEITVLFLKTKHNNMDVAIENLMRLGSAQECFEFGKELGRGERLIWTYTMHTSSEDFVRGLIQGLVEVGNTDCFTLYRHGVAIGIAKDGTEFSKVV